MSALLIVHKDATGKTTNVPFVYKDGNLLEVLENIAKYIVDAGAVDTLWEGVATDRLHLIHAQKVHIKELESLLEELMDGAYE